MIIDNGAAPMGPNASPAPGAGSQHQVDDRAVNEAPAWQRWLISGSTWVLGLDILLILLFGILSPQWVFFSSQNLQNQLLNGTEALLLAIAMTLLLGGGLIDLSLGANLVLSSVVSAIVIIYTAGGTIQALGGAGGETVFSHVGLALLFGLLASILTGAIYGAVNGWVIAYLRVNSLIATLGTLSVGTGLTLIISKGADIGGLPGEIQDNFGLATFGHVPLPALVGAAVAVAAWAIVRYLRFGVYTLAIGSSRLSAERAGIEVKVHIVKLAVVAGALAGLAGFVNIAHFGSTTINGHFNDPLAAITAAVIGGAALAGGRVSIIGTVWGAALAGILLSGLVIVGVSAFYQLIAIGSILVAAVAIDQFRNRRRDTA